MSEIPDRLIQELKESEFFDADWYADEYPDVKMTAIDPVRHYLEIGSRLNRNPSSLFDTEYYLSANPDVARAGMDALIHFIRHGRDEGRKPRLVEDPNPVRFDKNGAAAVQDAGVGDDAWQESSAVMAALETQSWKSESHLLPACCELLNSGFWDEQYYLENYFSEFSDARRLKGQFYSPLEFYVEEGWRRGHFPSEKFKLTIHGPLECNPVSYFLNQLRFEGHHFDENVWLPEESSVSSYLSQKNGRKAKSVVYTCIANDYNQLMQPYVIDDDWDYICFTDSAALLAEGYEGVWEIRKMQVADEDPSRQNRWHKLHPHILFPSYEESIYIDGNINIVSNYIYRKVRSVSTSMLFPQHFARNCIYDEIEALLHSQRTSPKNKGLLEEQLALYENSHFPRNFGLSENNLIYRRHHKESVIRMMHQWWRLLCDYSSRDQASLSYVLWKNNINIKDIQIPNCRIDYRNFWIVKHKGEQPDIHRVNLDQKIEPAFPVNRSGIVMSCNQNFVSYLSVVLESIVENSNPLLTYDIIILESDIISETKESIVLSFSEHKHVSIRFYNMNSVLTLLGDLDMHVDGYVPLETYNKIFLHEITRGYERIAYIDTDIVVNTDIAELCNIELWGKSLGASPNIANIHAAHIEKEIKGRNFKNYLSSELGISDYNHYFQAGIVVLDMQADRVRHLLDLCIAKLRSIKEPIFYDQCIFNSVFYGDVHFISCGWNHVWYLQNYSYLRGTVSDRLYFDYARSRVEPKIVHFASKDKPTNTPGWKLSEYFWKYAQNSPFYSEIVSGADEKVVAGEIERLKLGWREIRRPRLLVHLHVFYIDQIDFMVNALSNINSCDVDIYVTASEQFDDVERLVSARLPSSQFMQVPNSGYDVYPFLQVLQRNNLSTYDYVLKLHTKNARPPSRDTVYGIHVPEHAWRDELVNALLGSKEIFTRNLELLEQNDSVGAVGAARYLFSTLDNHEEQTYKLKHWRAMLDIEQSNHYIGGTMFMARSYLFERFKLDRLGAFEFGVENSATGSHKDNAHVFERLFGLVVESEGFYLNGV